MTETENTISDRLYAALELAFRLHGRDARKSSRAPVMAHLLSVCAMVQHESDDEDEAVAALLHDALEDKPNDGKTREEILERFGERVLRIIEISTDTPPDYMGGPKPEWKLRNQAYIDHIRETDPGLLRVTVADKVDNARAILADHRQVGDEVWQRFTTRSKMDQQWYYTKSLEAYDVVRFKGGMLEDLRQLVAKINAL
jgi:(p)ppGpp synthase/HD superfamily hydrolase